MLHRKGYSGGKSQKTPGWHEPYQIAYLVIWYGSCQPAFKFFSKIEKAVPFLILHGWQSHHLSNVTGWDPGGVPSRLPSLPFGIPSCLLALTLSAFCKALKFFLQALYREVKLSHWMIFMHAFYVLLFCNNYLLHYFLYGCSCCTELCTSPWVMCWMGGHKNWANK